MRAKKELTILFLLIACASLAHALWPYRVIGAGYVFVQSDGGFDYIKNHMESYRWYQDMGGSSAVFTSKGGYRHLFHDGYSSLDFDPSGREAVSEMLIGGSVASLLPEDSTNNLLVIGFGSGTSTGVGSRVFDSVKVYETRESMIEIADREFVDYNFDVVDASNVDINIQDGIVGAAISKKGEYDAALINVPSPGIRGAEKLYSVEAYKLIAEKVKKHGLIFTWISGGLGGDVLQVILNNFDAAFSDRCRYFLLSSSYAQIICAPHMSPDVFRSIVPRDLGVTDLKGYDLGYLTRISEIDRYGDPSPSLKGRIHTLDNPWFDTRALFESVFEPGYDFYDAFELKNEISYERYENFEYPEQQY